MLGLATKSDAVLFVDDPNGALNPSPTDLYSRTFRLTPAEARLAVRLASGASLMESADEFGVTHNTVRAQLRAIFDKTGTHRQIDLVRLLQRSSSLRIALS
jgi:DNA-binding CsgD family transcriptional regulator